MSPKKKVHKLILEFETDFKLIGIASHENDYRLSWAINKALSFELAKINDLAIKHPKHKTEVNYSMYNYNDDVEYINYHLISNKSEKGFLLPEMKNIDFLIKVSGNPEIDFLNDLITKLKKVDIIITAFLIEELPEKFQKMFTF